MTEQETTFVEQCREFLQTRWTAVSTSLETEQFHDQPLPNGMALRKSIVACLTSPTKSYHYVLPTQILAKCVKPSLDCRSLQASYDGRGAFDARTVAHKVIVPFDQANHRVLGGSPEPYVNNPLRCPGVIPMYRDQQKNKADWDSLAVVLDAVEEANRREFTRQVFDQILAEIYRLLSGVQVLYPTPNRVSLAETTRIVREFIAAKSGGDRPEAVCTALFRAIASEFKLFDAVCRQKVNAADIASGMGADIECKLTGEIVLLVEVKDCALTLTQIDAKVDAARAKKISELLFLVEHGIAHAECPQVEERIQNEFASGQNVYISNFIDFSAGIFILLGEKGRVHFLSLVGEELDRGGSSISHRRTWAQLLKSL
jgi:hypothetical protein